MLDKEKTAELSNKAGVPSPARWTVNNGTEVGEIIDRVQFPCALKPRHSHLFSRYFPSIKLFVAQNAGELMDHYRKVEPYGLEMIVTEIIPGGDDQYFSYYTYIDQDGTPLFHFTKRKIRQFPAGFGQWTYHISGWYPDVAEMGLKYFKGIGLKGIGTVEFKRDERDGTLKVIDCNPRFTLAIELLKFCGIEWALLVYNKLNGYPLPSVATFNQGVRVLRPLSDFLAFRELRKTGLAAWFTWMKSISHRQHFQYFRWSDPMPSLVRILPMMKRHVHSQNAYAHR
jgi:predicted ATP-grasp superfamily ATP-dependent carboligase